MKFKSAQELQRRLINAFSSQKEISKIVIFGRNAEEAADEFSDIDIRIISRDPYKTQQKYLQIIGNISPILETFWLVSDKKQMAQMIMLRDYSPYQKIDFGINENIAFKPNRVVFENRNAEGNKTGLEITKIKLNVAYNLNNFLFGIPRFTKCLFRRDFDMYRRWKDMTNAFLILLYEKYFGYEKESKRKDLKAHEAKKLFSLLKKEDTNKLKKIFPLTGTLSTSDSFIETTKYFVKLSKEKAKHFKIPLNNTFIQYMLEFSDQEVNRFKNSIAI